MPDLFLKYYPKCRVIIDCTEVYIETPSSLEIAAMCQMVKLQAALYR